MSALSRMGLRCSLAALLCGSLWVVVWLSAPGASSTPFTPDLTTAPFDRSEVDELVITGPNGAATVWRHGEAWRLSLGERVVLADKERVEALLSRLVTLPLQPLANPGPLELYGLERPWLTIKLRSGVEEVGSLVLGDRVITEDARYARRPPLGGVFLVAGNDALPLLADGDILRDHRLVPFPEGDLYAIKLSRAGEEFSLLRQTKGFLLEARGETLQADPQEAQALLAALAQARVQAFAPPPEGPAPESEVRLSVETRSGTATLALLPTRSGLLARREILDAAGEVEDDLVRLPAGALLWLSPSLEGLRDRRILGVEESEVIGRVKIRWGEGFAVLEKTPDEGWKMATPRTTDLSETEVESFLGHLLRLKGSQEATSQEEALAALKSPLGEITLFSPSWEEIAGLVLSAPSPDGSVYVQARGGDRVVQLSSRDLALLDLSGWLRR